MSFPFFHFILYTLLDCRCFLPFYIFGFLLCFAWFQLSHLIHKRNFSRFPNSFPHPQIKWFHLQFSSAAWNQFIVYFRRFFREDGGVELIWRHLSLEVRRSSNQCQSSMPIKFFIKDLDVRKISQAANRRPYRWWYLRTENWVERSAWEAPTATPINTAKNIVAT